MTFCRSLNIVTLLETVLVGRVLVHGNNVGCGVFFLSIQMNPPTCPILWLWEGWTRWRGQIEDTHHIVQVLSWVRFCRASSKSWLKSSLPLWWCSCFYTLYQFTALAFWVASFGGVKLGRRKIEMFSEVSWEKGSFHCTPSLPRCSGWRANKL